MRFTRHMAQLFAHIFLSLTFANILLPCSGALGQTTPDLRPEISNITIRIGQSVSDADVVEGCASAATGRTLLAFDHLAWNDGPGDLSLGDPGCPDCDTTYVPVCTNPLFECSAAHGHNHAHLKNFSSYTVTKRGEDAVQVRGHKEGFCLVNSICKEGITAPPGGNCNQLTAGCADSYPGGLGCQYVDITHLRPGRYTLRVEINPLRTITEASYDNNIQTYDFEVCKQIPSSIKVTVGTGDQAHGGKRPFSVEAVMNYRSAASLKNFNPINNGLSPQLMLDDRSPLSSFTNLPPGKPGSGCFPNDGWRNTGNDTWEFRSDSELNPECQFNSTSGVHSAIVEKKGKSLFVTLRGRLEPTLVPPLPKSANFSLSWNGDPAGASINQTCQPDAVAKKCSRAGAAKTIFVCK